MLIALYEKPCSFVYLREMFNISDGGLASNMKSLENMNLITKEKIYGYGHPITLYHITRNGVNELRYVKEILETKVYGYNVS